MHSVLEMSMAAEVFKQYVKVQYDTSLIIQVSCLSANGEYQLINQSDKQRSVNQFDQYFYTYLRTTHNIVVKINYN